MPAQRFGAFCWVSNFEQIASECAVMFRWEGGLAARCDRDHLWEGAAKGTAQMVPFLQGIVSGMSPKTGGILMQTVEASERCRMRAEEARRCADDIRDTEAKQLMLRIAREYEELAGLQSPGREATSGEPAMAA
jgi:hypothetical protein